MGRKDGDRKPKHRGLAVEAGGTGSPTFMCGRQKPGGTPGEPAIPAPGQTVQPRVPIRRLWDISKSANIQIVGMPEGKEKEQEMDNLFEKIMEENFPHLVKQIDIQVQEIKSPKQVGPREDHTKTPHS